MEQGLGNFIPLKIAVIKAALDRAAYTLGIYTLVSNINWVICFCHAGGLVM